MAYGDQSRSGGGKKGSVLFLSRNTRPKNDRSPPYNGQGSFVVPEGARPGDVIDVWLGAWVKDNQHGEYFQITLTPKDQSPQRNQGSDRGYADDRPRAEREYRDEPRRDERGGYEDRSGDGYRGNHDDRPRDEPRGSDIPF